MDVVSAITDQMLTEECSRALAADVQEVLASSGVVSDLNDALGEPETEEERVLRKELGGNFLKCVELAVKLAETSPASTEDEAMLRQLLELMGRKGHLLADLQRVAALFES
jgi:ATP phosphoribosyltransferase regulatory subunit HisZ